MDWPAVGWVDIAMLAIVSVSALVGVVRGLTLELLSLAGWVVAWFAGLWVGPLLAPHLPVGAVGSPLNGVASFACAFIVALIVWGLMARVVSSLVKRTPLSPVDRLLGAVFGLLRGAAGLLAVVAVLAHTPAAATSAWRESIGVAAASTVLRELVPYVMPRRGESPAGRSV